MSATVDNSSLNLTAAESTSSSFSKHANNNKTKIELLMEENHALKIKYHDYRNRLQMADNKLLWLQAQKDTLEEKLKRMEVEAENRELKKEKDTNPNDETLKRQIEELVTAKSEQMLQQIRHELDIEMGKCERKLHDDYGQALNNSEKSLADEGKKQMRQMTKRIAALEAKVGEENAAAPPTKRIRFDDEKEFAMQLQEMEQRHKSSQRLQKELQEQFALCQQTVANLSAKCQSQIVTTKNRTTQDNSEEECSMDIEALVEAAHRKLLEEMTRQSDDIREELTKLGDDNAKRMTTMDMELAQTRQTQIQHSLVIAKLAKRYKEISGGIEALKNEDAEMKRSLEHQICSLKDWTFVDGRLQNVMLIRVNGNSFAPLCTKQQNGTLCANWPFPITAADLPSRRLFYFEVRVHNRKVHNMQIGLSNFDDGSIILSVNNFGNFHILDKEHRFYRHGGFSFSDVVGCGLLVLGESRHIFFTRNGKLWVKPFQLASNQLLAKDLYPTVIASDGQQAAVTPNFGDNPNLPFNFVDANLP